MDEEQTRAVRRIVAAFALGGGIAMLASLSLAPTFPARYGLAPSVVIALALALALALTDKFAIRVRVRGERVAMTMSDALFVVALVALSPAFAPLVAAAGSVLGQLLNKRSALKATFNVAHECLSAGVAAITTAALLVLGAPLLLAALPAPIVYAAVNHAAVASILARVERMPAGAILRQRMARWALVAVALGEVAVVGLATLVG